MEHSDIVRHAAEANAHFSVMLGDTNGRFARHTFGSSRDRILWIIGPSKTGKTNALRSIRDQARQSDHCRVTHIVGADEADGGAEVTRSVGRTADDITGSQLVMRKLLVVSDVSPLDGAAGEDTPDWQRLLRAVRSDQHCAGLVCTVRLVHRADGADLLDLVRLHMPFVDLRSDSVLQMQPGFKAVYRNPRVVLNIKTGLPVVPEQ